MRGLRFSNSPSILGVSLWAAVATGAAPCRAQPAGPAPHGTIRYENAQVMHDGRSVHIRAEAYDANGIPTDPGHYGAVDWVEGWNTKSAHLHTSRLGDVKLVFTGAALDVTDGPLVWDIWAWIADPTKLVLHADSPTLSFDTGWLQDSSGNSLQGILDQQVDNFSLAGC